MIKGIINRLFKNNKTTNRKEGIVKFFNTTKGFGFIKMNDSDDEIFVHSTNLLEKIRDNDNVKFDVEKGDKGMSAVRVSLI